MKCINLSLIGGVFVLGLLTGCTTLGFSDSDEKPPKLSAGAEAPVPLSPIQIKAQNLKAQPNLYKENATNQKNKLSTSVLAQFRQGLALKEQSKHADAKKLFISMSEKHPQLSGVWVQLGILSSIEKDHGKSLQTASRYFNHAISANPQNYMAHNQMAKVLRQQGQFKRALTHYEQALKSWPAFAQGYLNRGILYDLYMGEKSLALADYQLYQALSDQPSRQVKGWIADIQRQLKSAEQNNNTEMSNETE